MQEPQLRLHIHLMLIAFVIGLLGLLFGTVPPVAAKTAHSSTLQVPSGYTVGARVRADFDGDGKPDVAYVAKPPFLPSPDEMNQNPKQKPSIVYVARGCGVTWRKVMDHYYKFPLFTAVDMTGDGRPELLWSTYDPLSLYDVRVYHAVSYQKSQFAAIFGDGTESYRFDYVLVTQDRKGTYLIAINVDWYEGEGADARDPLYWYGDFFRWDGSEMKYRFTRKTRTKYVRRNDAIRALKGGALSRVIPKRAIEAMFAR